ncbi:MAG: helix-turn-helix domain-containing protein, partial [Spirochaetaceae bacterium]|nr:helix-turn-helix domain-containing protein [Spirochaetaceae bacterium]
MRDSALVLLVLALAVGSLASLRLASSQARPLGRLLSLLLRGEDHAEDRPGSVYQRAEEAILALSDSRDRLRAEAIEAEGTARAYFFRRLLEGAYRERALFEAEAARFGIDLSGSDRYVLICGMTAPEDAGDPAGASYADARGIPPGESGLEAGEYSARISLGETAYILKAVSDRKAFVERMAESIRATAPNEVRAGLSFACGRPVADPFLLQASYLQAKAALVRRASGAVEAVFYEDLPESPGGLRFAIDVEESIMKAVRSANGLLLSSLVDSVLRSNFSERILAPAEERDLATGLRIAALRLLPEFPSDSAALRERLYARSEPSDARASIEDCAAVLTDMAELAGRRKRSHNRALADQVRSFIERNYASRDLGLTMVADVHRLSENYLSNLYKEQEGECVSETIERVRIDAARRLLAEAAGSIDAIAAASGYANGVSFRRA